MDISMDISMDIFMDISMDTSISGLRRGVGRTYPPVNKVLHFRHPWSIEIKGNQGIPC